MRIFLSTHVHGASGARLTQCSIGQGRHRPATRFIQPFRHNTSACPNTNQPTNQPTNDKVTPCVDSSSNAQIKQELSYRKQIARKLRIQYVEGIDRPKYYTVTLKSRLGITQSHWKRNHCINHTRLTISQVI